VKHRILLVNAKTRGVVRPTGLEYLAEATVEAGYDVDLLDMAAQDDPEKLLYSRIDTGGYWIVGVSIFNTQWDTGRDQVRFFLPEIKEMIKKIRARTDTPIVLGGYGFSLQPDDILRYVGGDCGIAGCGIPAFQTLLRQIEEGVVKKGSVIAEEPREYLDTTFKRGLVDTRKYPENEEVFVSTKIGCFETCFHCPTVGTKFRLRKPEHVVAEVSSLANRGVKRISFMHDTFNVPVKHATAISEGISDLSIQWSAYIYPARRFLSPDLVKTMKGSGMARADIGSRMIGSEAMLRAYNVQFDARDIEFATQLFKANGIKTSWILGFGAPGETRETIDETFELIDRVYPDSVGILTRTRIYRYAPLARTCEREGSIVPTDTLLEPTYYPLEDDLRNYIFEKAEEREQCTAFY
jgi:radical SAM superfamily enzyme YgiQ (UPF0313 family)